MKTLILPVKREYFEAIRDGTKPEEYRLKNLHWSSRLAQDFFDEVSGNFGTRPRKFSSVVITLGYPPKTDTTRRLEFPWNGYQIKTITHPHFGPDPVTVFAIKLQKHP